MVTLPIELAAPGGVKHLDGKSEEVAAQSDTVKISNTLVRDMRKLGIEVKAGGVVTTDLGFAFITKKAIAHCVEELDRLLQPTDGKQPGSDEIHTVASSLSKLARAMSAVSNKNFGEQEAPTNAPSAPRRSFAPNQNAQFHVHYHQETAK